MRRNFVKLPAGDQTIGFQFAQCLCQHGVRDTGQIFFQNPEPYGVIDAEFIDNQGFTISLQHFKERGHGAVSTIR